MLDLVIGYGRRGLVNGGSSVHEEIPSRSHHRSNPEG